MVPKGATLPCRCILVKLLYNLVVLEQHHHKSLFVIEAVKESYVKKCIFLSTDKSVYPINAMGMTKALMEKVMISKSKIYQTVFSLRIIYFNNHIPKFSSGTACSE